MLLASSMLAALGFELSGGRSQPLYGRSSARFGRPLLSAASDFARDGAAFVPSFLAKPQFETVLEDCRKLRGKLKAEKASIAIGRLGRVVDSRSAAFGCLTSDATCELMSRLAGGTVEPSDYPIELRVYKPGAAMDWHRDDLLYSEPQCELVLCLENTSDSRTEWTDADGGLHAEWTPPNSALLVKAGEGGASHRVLPLKRGERTIVKMVWRTPGSERLEEFYDQLDSLAGLRRKQRPKSAARGRQTKAAERRRR